MASAIPLFPGQQEADPGAAGALGQASNLPQAAASTSNAGAWQSSGHIGPFFGVISVLVVLAVVSCFVGRIITRNGEVLKMAAPLDHINGGGCGGGGWMGKVKRKLGWSCGHGNDRDNGRPVGDGDKVAVSPA